MKRILLLSIFCLLANLLLGQVDYSNRYKKAIFSQNTKQFNIKYADADKYDVFGLNILEPLHLDFYEPAGDTATKRPVALAFFGGAYLIGDKLMQDMTAWCDSLASYGYACAAVNYRLGYNTLVPASAVRAGYRALQDARAAIRFLKENHATYKIDTNQIYVLGNSAGALTAIQTAYGQEDERPAQTYGVSGSLAEGADLGCMDCSGNNYQHTVDVAAVLGMWGAAVSVDALDPFDDAPIIMFHGDNDVIVPIDSGDAFNTGILPSVYGSRTIHKAKQALGQHSELHVYPGQPHNFYYDVAIFPNAYWDTIWTLSHDFLCRVNPYCTSTLTAVEEAKQLKNELNVVIYPNPAQEQVTIYISTAAIQEEKVLKVYSIQGKEYAFLKSRQNTLNLDVKDWPAGMYFVQIQAGNNRTIQKLLIE
ncbi:MAG: T9SS type A sorting domain-containing protein [Aureispira sp.]|nr:T9SS type A sorting domain-containing protein [Aureispira sp.]